MRVNNSLRSNQEGFASLVVALILILVLSLITVGFAQLARREQQSALNKQLAVQAYYASETGINDGYNRVITPNTGLLALAEAGTIVVKPNVCLNKSPDPTVWATSSQIDTSTGTSYSCVMVDLSPPTIEYSGVSAGAYRDVLFTTQDLNNNDTNPGSFTVSWGSSDQSVAKVPQNSPGDKFKPLTGAGAWGNSPAVIELSITPLTATFDRDYLINNTYTVYLYPKQGGSGGPYNLVTSGKGKILEADCTGSGKSQCKVTLNNIPALPAGGKYQVHFLDYYDKSDVSINGKDSSGNALRFFGGQVMIDSTGRARDTLKRLQVHMPITNDGDKPAEAIEGQSVCKRIQTYPAQTTFDTSLGTACNLSN